jgi:pimeloyl-ACP methyl ester carboxylesterase
LDSQGAAHLSPADAAECATMVREFESAAGASLQRSAQRSPGVGSYCAYVGRVAWRHRPLAFYALSHAVGGMAWTGRTMRGHGFERRRQTLTRAAGAAAGKTAPAASAAAGLGAASFSFGKAAAADAADDELNFWFRPADPGAEGDDAVVFIHGIGIGPAPYMEWVMAAAAGRGDATSDTSNSGSGGGSSSSSGSGSGPRPATLVVELACVSQRVSWRAPPPPLRFAALMECALAECLGDSSGAVAQKIVVVGHSLGSAFATYLTAKGSACAHRVSGSVLVDPIACLLFHDRVTKSFVFPDVVTVFDAADDYFVKKELFASGVVSRHLPWHQANVWLDDLGASVPTLVAVSDDDAIVPADAVAAHFGSWPARLRGVRVLRLPGCGHGAWLASPLQAARLAASVKSLRQEASLLGAAKLAAGEVAGSAASARDAVGSALNGYLGRGASKRAPRPPPGLLLQPPWEMWVRGLNQRSSAPS